MSRYAHVSVVVVNNDVESAWRRYRKQLLRTGLQRDIARTEEYVKPSLARRRKSKLARTRARKAARRQQQREPEWERSV